jgi:predicted metal-dependent enzyme (double-stranded beta helix superfamily)
VQTELIEQDMARMLADIQAMTEDVTQMTREQLMLAANQLEAFVARYRGELDWSGFPLPQADTDILCSYRLHGEHGDALCLELQAIHGDVHTPIHDHGTWAVLVAVAGSELHQLYRGPANVTHVDELTLDREVEVSAGKPLVLEAGVFHRMSTNAPALQLHLYGKPLEHVPTRRIVDQDTGRILQVPAGT